MDALIFDFDGVVIDSEPIHLEGFQRVLQPLGVRLRREDYYAKYLGLDDHDCLAAALRDHGADCTERLLRELVAAKTAWIKKAFGRSIRPMPGAVSLVRGAHEAGVPLAVCSGALRDEIELASRQVGVWECFTSIVSADDVERGKPDPEGYRTALARLRQATGRQLRSERSVVVEDAPAGVQAAREAGMKVLALTSSYPADALRGADRIVNSLEGVLASSLDELL